MAMNTNSPFLELPWACEDALDWLQHRLAQAGMQVIRTFDLQSARLAASDCPCPHHGTQRCACQMVVLLVYKEGSRPVSVIAHGHDQQTWFALVDTAEQPADPVAAEAVQDLATRASALFSLTEPQVHSE